MPSQSLPVVVIGAGPVGLAAAAHLILRGETPVVLEAGPSIGSGVLSWAHVRTFSPWRYTIDAAARELLEPTGWQEPDLDESPTGADLADRYLRPLADLPEMRRAIFLDSRVIAITRLGMDKLKTEGRADAPFVVRVDQGGAVVDILARAVIDASGTTSTPNPLGAGGTPAAGEADAAERLFYGIPDVLGRHRARYAGKRVIVFGSGHSAFNALLDLATLKNEAPATQISWAVRGTDLARALGGGERDQLPGRGRLGANVEALLQTGAVRLHSGVQVTAIRREASGLRFDAGDVLLPEVDEAIIATGFRPDLSLTRELRLGLDEVVESPVALAPLIDPNVHSCGTVPPHGAAQLAHPEPNFYTVGMKSYGRAPTFLMLTGYEQVRSVVAALTGDEDGAREVRLVLPETGVCSSESAPSTGDCGATGEPELVAAGCG